MFLVPPINYVFLKNIQLKDKTLSKIINDDYCVIVVKNNFIFCSYFRYSQYDCDQYYRIDFYSSSANGLFDLMNQHNYLSCSISLSHALYLGKEIYKAQLATTLLQLYIQS